MQRLSVILICSILLSTITIRADTVFLTNGMEVEGTVTEDGKSVVIIRTHTGSVRTFRRAEVDAVVRDKSTMAAPPPSPSPVNVSQPTLPPAVNPEVKSIPDKPADHPLVEPGPTSNPNLVWSESLVDAMALAKSRSKLILANFTGSDWCVFCKKLEKEVFSTPDFEAWANENFILLKLDLPTEKVKQDPATRKQNQDLVKKFEISGYPTVVILTADGNEVARKAGYSEKGAKPWIAVVTELMKK